MAQAQGTQAQGTIVQCIGAVTDIEFSRDTMPGIYDALILEDSAEGGLVEKGLTFEVEQQLGDGVVRYIALVLCQRVRRDEGEHLTGAPLSLARGREPCARH